MLYVNEQPIDGSILAAQVEANFKWHKIAVIQTKEPFTAESTHIEDRQDEITVHYDVDKTPLKTFHEGDTYYTWLPLIGRYVENTAYQKYYETTKEILPNE